MQERVLHDYQKGLRDGQDSIRGSAMSVSPEDLVRQCVQSNSLPVLPKRKIIFLDNGKNKNKENVQISSPSVDARHNVDLESCVTTIQTQPT